PFVLWPDGDAIGVALDELVYKGHRRPGPSAIKQRPVAAFSLDLLEHRENRSNADTARDEPVARCVNEWKVVARAAHLQGDSLLEVVVNVLRTTATVGIAQHPDTPHTRITRIAAQRVLARQLFTEEQVDMGSRLPPR